MTDDRAEGGLCCEVDVRVQRADPLRTKSYLCRGLFPRDHEGPCFVACSPRCNLEQQRRLADARLASEQHDATRHEPATEDSVELTDSGRAHARGVRVDGTDRLR